MTTSLVAITCKAFKAFAGSASLVIEDFPCGLHLVRGRNRTNDRLGSNGAGKSTFFSDAVTWCLYGRTVGGLRTTDVQSWLTKTAPYAAVALRRGDPEPHTVARGPRASALTINGRVVGQADVDALVGLDYAAWCQAIIWGQGEPLFFDLAAGAKMELLSTTLGLERWERRAVAAGARARRLEDRRQGLEGEVRGLEAARDHARGALARARTALEEWAASLAARIKENEQTAALAAALAAALEAKQGEAALAADSAGTAAKVGRPLLEEARVELAESEEAVRREAGVARACAAELEEAAAHLAAFRDETCPTCGQAVGKKDARAHQKELRETITGLEKEIARADRAAKKNIDRARVLRKRLAENEAHNHALEATAEKAESELRILIRAQGEAQAKSWAAQDALQQNKAEENPHRAEMRAAREHLAKIKAQVTEKGEKVRRLAASIERAQFWARGFREIRLGIIDDILDDLRGTTAEVLDRLGLGDWIIDYQTERETKSGTTQRALAVIVRAPTAAEAVRWDAYSGGERQRLRLAGAMALSEVLLAHAGVSLDFRVLDEPTRGLSPEGVADLVEMLGSYAEAVKLKIFMIDHAAIEGGGFASTITIENGSDGATIKS